MNKFGFNIQVPGAGLDLIGRFKPVASLLMDIKSEHVAEAKRLSPETEIIFRKEDGRHWQDKDPVEWAQAMYSDVQDFQPDYVVLDNEPLGHGASGEFAALDRWQRNVADWLHVYTSMKVGMFSFPEGNFTKGGPNIAECFPLSMEAADAVFIHEYWKPHLDSPGMIDWHCLRWPYWLKWFEEAGYPNLPIYVTEVGITMAVGGGPDVGYASEEAKAAGVTVESYLADLEGYHRQCCLKPRLRAVLPFIWRTWPNEWGSFVPTEAMTQRMFSFDAPGTDPEPEPEPNGGNNMRVFNLAGEELFGADADDLIAKHGFTFTEPTDLRDGELYLKAVVAEEREGPACFIMTVLKEDGTPCEGIQTAWAWAEAMGDADDIKGDNYPTDWQSEADLGVTKADGTNAPGFGQTGWYHGEYESGPGRAWIRHLQCWATFVRGVGMLTGTNHRTLYITWQLVPFQSDQPVPPGELGDQIRALAGELMDIAGEVDKQGSGVTKVKVVMGDGTVIDFSPAGLSITARVWNKLKALAGR
jgi:hypothetical protein